MSLTLKESFLTKYLRSKFASTKPTTDEPSAGYQSEWERTSVSFSSSLRLTYKASCTEPTWNNFVNFSMKTRPTTSTVLLILCFLVPDDVIWIEVFNMLHQDIKEAEDRGGGCLILYTTNSKSPGWPAQSLSKMGSLVLQNSSCVISSMVNHLRCLSTSSTDHITFLSRRT